MADDYARPSQLMSNPGFRQDASSSGPDLSHILQLIKQMAGGYFSGFNNLRAPQQPSGLPTNPVTNSAIRAGGAMFGNNPVGGDINLPAPMRPPVHHARPSPLMQAIAMKQPMEGPGVAGMGGSGLQSLPSPAPDIPVGPGPGPAMEQDPLSSHPTSWGQFGPEQNANAMNGLPAGLGGQPGLSDSHPGKLQALLHAILGGR